MWHPPYFLQKERPISDVPKSIKIFLALALCLQLLWHGVQAPITAKAESLPAPLSVRSYVMSSLGEPLAAAKFLNLWLQAFDNQPGASLSFNQLDYPRLTQWLDTILELDDRGHYPMLVAARVYGSIKNVKKQRVMMEYIYTRFIDEPNKYWRWMAHAVIVAKHELHDLELAYKYADALNALATAENVPYWARDMKIFILEDMGELEAAKILVGALIDSKEITDKHELNFLIQKITELEQEMMKSQQSVEK